MNVRFISVRSIVWLNFRLALGSAAPRVGCFVLLMFLPILGWGSTTTNSCSKFVDYRVVSPTVILIQCSKAYETSADALSVKLVSVGDIATSDLNANISTTPDPNASDWMAVTIGVLANGTAGKIEGGKHYTLALIAPTSGKIIAKIDVDTTGIATITQDPADLSGRSFLIASHTAFPALDPKTIQIGIHNFSGNTNPLDTHIRVTDPMDPSDQDPFQGGTSPTSLGIATFKLKRPIIFHSQVAFQLSGFKDVLGQTAQPKSSDRVKIPVAPTTEALSWLYLKGDYAAGAGSKPAWVLQGKLAPMFIKPFGGWQLYPDLETDIGNNTITNIKYTDTVDFGLDLSREDDTKWKFAKAIGLQHVSTTGGFVYETDKELDRDNALGTASFLLRFSHLYDLQSARKSDSLMRAKNDPRNKGIDVTPDDISTPIFGYELDFSPFFEAGSALKDTVTKATTGGATILVPSFRIARVGPQVHGTLQLWNVTLDVKGAGRYLLTTENTTRQLRNNSLLLIPINAWHGNSEADLNWNIDPTGHLALNLTYKNGFAPPNFTRVNTVQAGILLKF